MRIALLFAFVVLSATAQTNPLLSANRLEAPSNAPAETAPSQKERDVLMAQRIEKIRADCIQNRRHICGKILKVLPDGLVIDSGYTNLMRSPLDHSWLAPGTATAVRPDNVIEGNQPDADCVGLVFLTDIPKKRGIKPELYDYVNLQAFPAGQYTYTSVGDLQRTVRKFSTKLPKAIEWKLQEGEK